MTSEDCNQQVVDLLASMVLDYLKNQQQKTEEKTKLEKTDKKNETGEAA